MKIIQFVNKQYKGDNNQVTSIGSALRKHIDPMLTSEMVKVETVEEAESEQTIRELDQPSIGVTCGTHGLGVFDREREKSNHVYWVWTSHQYIEALESLEVFPYVMALPKTAVTEAQVAFLRGHTQLILTDGVAHNAAEAIASHAILYQRLQHSQNPIVKAVKQQIKRLESLRGGWFAVGVQDKLDRIHQALYKLNDDEDIVNALGSDESELFKALNHKRHFPYFTLFGVGGHLSVPSNLSRSVLEIDHIPTP